MNSPNQEEESFLPVIISTTLLAAIAFSHWIVVQLGAFRHSVMMNMASTYLLGIEAGMVVVLSQLGWILPRVHLAKWFGVILTVIIVSLQMLTRYEIVVSSFFMTTILGQVGISWILQRFTGLVWSYGGEPLGRKPLSVRDLLLLVPLLLSLGMGMVLVLEGYPTDFAFAAIRNSSILFVIGSFTYANFLLLMYRFATLIRSNRSFAPLLGVAMIVFVSLSLGLALTSNSPSKYTTGILMWIGMQWFVFVVGIVFAYFPFFVAGFYPVWCHHEIRYSESDIKFDDIT